MNLSAKILSFLDLGYFLDYSGQTVRLPGQIRSLDQEGLTREDLFITLRQKLLRSFDEGYIPGQFCVVPLSGGLDSRAVLGGLLQFTDASNIITYTYGVPGSFDYEIAARVARSVGVNNIRIPLNNYDFLIDELIDASRSMDQQTLLFFHAPLRIIRREFSGSVHWSGFLGEAITGAHLLGPLATTEHAAEDKFMVFNRYVRGQDALRLRGGHEYSYRHLLRPSSEQGFLTYEEGYDLLNRQNKYIAPHVMLKGAEHRAPFNSPDVIGFFLGLSESQKRQQVFFKDFLQWWKPDLFELPVKNNVGFPLNAWQWQPALRKKMFGLFKRIRKNWKDPNRNYFDFSSRIIVDERFKSLVKNQLDSLTHKKVVPDVISIPALWREHQNGRADHGRLLQGLVSLEIHLKSGKEL